MSVYAVALITIHDRDAYARYGQGFMEIFEQHSGRLLAVDEAPHVLEGEWPWTRTVLLEFPDQAALDGWYRSADYQALAQHRHQCSDAAIAVLRGLDQP
jgi:uncharacterized protein (DUF1330 family)